MSHKEKDKLDPKRPSSFNFEQKSNPAAQVAAGLAAAAVAARSAQTSKEAPAKIGSTTPPHQHQQQHQPPHQPPTTVGTPGGSRRPPPALPPPRRRPALTSSDPEKERTSKVGTPPALPSPLQNKVAVVEKGTVPASPRQIAAKVASPHVPPKETSPRILPSAMSASAVPAVSAVSAASAASAAPPMPPRDTTRPQHTRKRSDGDIVAGGPGSAPASAKISPRTAQESLSPTDAFPSIASSAVGQHPTRHKATVSDPLDSPDGLSHNEKYALMRQMLKKSAAASLQEEQKHGEMPRSASHESPKQPPPEAATMPRSLSGDVAAMAAGGPRMPSVASPSPPSSESGSPSSKSELQKAVTGSPTVKPVVVAHIPVKSAPTSDIPKPPPAVTAIAATTSSSSPLLARSSPAGLHRPTPLAPPPVLKAPEAISKPEPLAPPPVGNKTVSSPTASQSLGPLMPTLPTFSLDSGTPAAKQTPEKPVSPFLGPAPASVTPVMTPPQVVPAEPTAAAVTAGDVPPPLPDSEEGDDAGTEGQVDIPPPPLPPEDIEPPGSATEISPPPLPPEDTGPPSTEIGPPDIPPPPVEDAPPPSADDAPPDATPAAAAAAAEESMSKKRRAICAEILSTEQTYVAQLWCVVSQFLEPGLTGLTRQEIYELFTNIEIIYTCHRKFLEALQASIKSWTGATGIGDVFLAANWIKLYKYYINNYDTAAKKLAEHRTLNDAFRDYLKKLEFTPQMQKNNLESLLVVPVQRIPRYVLLLTDLVKNTPPEHTDYGPLSEALEKVKELADYINQSKCEAENMAQLDKLQKKFENLPFKLQITKRRLIKEGPMMVDKKKGHLWLFNDLFFISTAEKKGKFRFKRAVMLATAALQLDPENVMRLISTEGTLQLHCQSEPEIIAWKKALDSVLDAAKESLIKSAFSADTSLAESEGSRQFNEIMAQKNAEKRVEVVKRFIASEVEYAQFLDATTKYFLLPIKRSPDSSTPMISATAAQTIISNFDKLSVGHNELAICLQDREKEWSPTSTLADILVDKTEFLTGYRYYISHNFEQLDALEQAGNAPVFILWLRDVEAKHANGTNLRERLLVPRKRISEFYLAMQEIFQLTEKGRPDFEQMKQIVAKLQSLSEDLSKKSGESKHVAITGGPSLSRTSSKAMISKK